MLIGKLVDITTLLIKWVIAENPVLRFGQYEVSMNPDIKRVDMQKTCNIYIGLDRTSQAPVFAHLWYGRSPKPNRSQLGSRLVHEYKKL